MKHVYIVTWYGQIQKVFSSLRGTLQYLEHAMEEYAEGPQLYQSLDEAKGTILYFDAPYSIDILEVQQ